MKPLQDENEIQISSDIAESLVARYSALRQITIEINNTILSVIPREAVLASAEALGLLHQGSIYFNSDSESMIFADHTIHANPRARCEYLDTYRKANAKTLTSEQSNMLIALENVRFTILRCEKASPGVGVQVYDVLRDHRFLLLDITLSHSAHVGLLVAAHIISIDDLHLTTGAGLPILDQKVGRKVSAALPDENEIFDEANATGTYTTKITRILMEYIAFIERQAESQSFERASQKVPRNAPCPCGSGKKYKICCG
ncbi:MAG: SEC-C domain-containing protein [bacterium]